MQEFESALGTQGKHISAVLLSLGWRRKRQWNDIRRYRRYWLPPASAKTALGVSRRLRWPSLWPSRGTTTSTQHGNLPYESRINRQFFSDICLAPNPGPYSPNTASITDSSTPHHSSKTAKLSTLVRTYSNRLNIHPSIIWLIG